MDRAGGPNGSSPLTVSIPELSFPISGGTVDVKFLTPAVIAAWSHGYLRQAPFADCGVSHGSGELTLLRLGRAIEAIAETASVNKHELRRACPRFTTPARSVLIRTGLTCPAQEH